MTKSCIEEYGEQSLDEIIACIENPQVGTVPVHRDETNATPLIRGTNTEDKSINEGTVSYDIRFYAAVPGDQKIEVIINVEFQNYHEQSLMKRAVYYACRMISSQYGVEFIKSEYNKIKKVYSIWIHHVPNASQRNTVTDFAMTENPRIGTAEYQKDEYDLLHVIMIGLGRQKDQNYTGIIKFLGTLFSSQDIEEKKRILNEEFGMKMNETMEKETVIMSNRGHFLYEEGREEGREEERKKMAIKLSSMGIPMEQIAKAAGTSIETVREWIEETAVLTK